MPTNSGTAVFHELRRMVLPRDGDGRTDGQLLRDFVAHADHCAFASLVRRHGNMVFGVCRRVLANVHDAEDAFQAAFLVLARKAHSLRSHEQVGGWLYTVAYRIALQASARNSRRRTREKPMIDLPEKSVDPDPAWQEMLPALDREISKLPEKYRLPVILCELEGRSRQEAARCLKVPQGTLSSRLATARKMLARRLASQVPGVTSSVWLLASNGVQASPSAALQSATVCAAARFAIGESMAGAVSTRVLELTQGAIKAMFLSKMKLVAALSLAVAVLFGTGLGVHIAWAARPLPLAAKQGELPSDPMASASGPLASPNVSAVVPNAFATDAEQKEPNEKEKKDPPAVDTLKDKLKKYEDEIVKLRAAMLLECQKEEKRLEEAIKAARKEQADAKNDPKKAAKAQQTASALQLELFKVKNLAHSIEANIRVGSKPAPEPSMEQRLGLRFGMLSETVAKQLRLEKDTGIIVETVAADSLASKAGFMKHDILLKLDGKTVPTNLNGVHKLFAELMADATIDVVVLREGKQVPIKGLKIPSKMAKDE